MKDKTVKEIAKIRATNNLLWMSLLELALTAAPKQAKQILAKITKNDRKVSSLTRKLAK